MSQIENIAAELSLWANESEVLYSKTNDLVFRNISQHLNLLSAYTYRLLDEPSGGVSSFNTRIGDVVLLSSDVTTALTYTPVTEARTLTINGVTYDLSANRSWTISTATPTLAQVTTAGNTTTNAITVGGLTVNTNLLYTDTVNSRVGIGTTSPTRTLTVNGPIVIPNNNAYLTKTTAGSELAVFLADTSNNVQIGSIFFGGSLINYTANLFDWYNYPSSVLTHRMRLTASGNLLVGTTTDAGYKLDVNGTGRFQGSANTTPLTISGYSVTGANTTRAIDLTGTWNTSGNVTALNIDVTNTASGIGSNLINASINGSTNIFSVRRDGSVLAQNTFAFHASSGNISAAASLALATSFSQQTGIIAQRSQPISATSGDFFTLSVDPVAGNASTNTFIPTSGTATYTAFRVVPTINQTGGANGITRGIYVNPTITAAADFRAIETTVGRVILGSTSGNVMIGTTTDAGYKLDVNGTARVSGNLTVDTNTLFVDATNDRVGIGTITPTTLLDVGTTSSGIIRASGRIQVGSAASTLAGTYSGVPQFFAGNNTNDTGIRFFATSTDAVMSATYFTTGSYIPIEFFTSDIERLRIAVNGNIGIGTTSPTYKVDVQGTTTTSGISTDIGLNLNPVTNPSTGSVSLVASAGNVDLGIHYYWISYTTAIGETGTYNIGNVTTVSGSQQVLLTIPVSSDYRVTGRKLHRTKANGNSYETYVITTIANNTATTYTDNIADSALTGVMSAGYYQINTTNQGISVSASNVMRIDRFATHFGVNAGGSINGGGNNTLFGYNAGRFISTGNQNVGVGTVLGALTTGGDNVAIGPSAAASITVGGANIMIGRNAAANMNGNSNQNTIIGGYAWNAGTPSAKQSNTGLGYFVGSTNTGNNNLFLGNYAGYYVTGSNNILLDTILRADEATSKSAALIYGVTNATASSQTLSLGGGGNVMIGTITNAGYRLDVNGTARVSGNLTATGTISSTSTTTGQSLISSGLVVNNAAGGTANDNFIVKSLLLPSLLYVDAVNNKIGINTSTPLQLLDVNGVAQANQFKLSTLNTAPATATSTGTLGEIRIDASYIYVCITTNSWKRAAIATW
jgi:hypothetical protein